MINQLFNCHPSIDLTYNIVKLFGLHGLSDPSYFSKYDMRERNTVSKIKNTMIEDLKRLYLKCKAKSYLTDLDEKSVLTILRQILRYHGYQLISRSKCKDGNRYQIYRILSKS